jgi:hypothetical protein
MAGRKATGARRGPKPHARKEDIEAVQKVVNKLLRRVNEIHAIVVPDSKANEPEPGEPASAELAAATVGAEVLAVTPAPAQLDLPVNGATLPVEAEVVITTAPVSPVLKPTVG